MVDDQPGLAPDVGTIATCNFQESNPDLYQLNVLLNISSNKVTFNFVPRAPIIKDYIEEFINKSSKNNNSFILANDRDSILSQITEVTNSLSKFLNSKMDQEPSFHVPYIVNKYFEDIATSNNIAYNMGGYEKSNKPKKKRFRKVRIQERDSQSSESSKRPQNYKERKRHKTKPKEILGIRSSECKGNANKELMQCPFKDNNNARVVQPVSSIEYQKNDVLLRNTREFFNVKNEDVVNVYPSEYIIMT